MDPKYGLYHVESQYHMDQVPLEFSQASKGSYSDKDKRECWIVGAKVDITKRQVTLQLCFHAEGPQNVHPAIIFREKPTKILIYKKSTFNTPSMVFVIWKTKGGC